MTHESFAALAQLLRLRQGPQREAARLVLVDGMRQADAARAVGVSPSALGNTLRACRSGLELARSARPQGPTVVMEPQEAASAGAPMDFANPQWGQGSAVHNWQNYVSEEVQSLWMGFSQAQRAALARQAEALADKEEWD